LVHNLQKTGRPTLVIMIWFHPDNIESGGKCGFAQYWNSQQPLGASLCLCILDWPGLNFNAINLCKFLIDILQIEVGMSILGDKKSSAFLLRFTIMKFATGSSEWDDIMEIVPFYHIVMPKCLHLRNMYKLIKPRERPEIWWISTFL